MDLVTGRVAHRASRRRARRDSRFRRSRSKTRAARRGRPPDGSRSRSGSARSSEWASRSACAKTRSRRSARSAITQHVTCSPALEPIVSRGQTASARRDRARRGRRHRDGARRAHRRRSAPTRRPRIARARVVHRLTDGRVDRRSVLMRAFLLGAIRSSRRARFPTCSSETHPSYRLGTDVVAEDASEAGVDAGDPCDKDHDGYKAWTTAAAATTATTTTSRGTRARRNSSPTYPTRHRTATGTVTAKSSRSIRSSPACALQTCSARTFIVNTGCGISNPFVTCAAAITCGRSTPGTRTQGCR